MLWLSFIVTVILFLGMLLLFGAYLAWETRKVHIPALNDSKLIGVSVYNVIIPCLLITPVLTVLGNNPDVMFVLTSVLTVLCTSVTLILVFVPKVRFCTTNKIEIASRIENICTRYYPFPENTCCIYIWLIQDGGGFWLEMNRHSNTTQWTTVTVKLLSNIFFLASRILFSQLTPSC